MSVSIYVKGNYEAFQALKAARKQSQTKPIQSQSQNPATQSHNGGFSKVRLLLDVYLSMVTGTSIHNMRLIVTHFVNLWSDSLQNRASIGQHYPLGAHTFTIFNYPVGLFGNILSHIPRLRYSSIGRQSSRLQR